MEGTQIEAQEGDYVMIQNPATIPEDHNPDFIIPEIRVSLHQIIKLDEDFAHLKDDGKIERYRISKVLRDKKSFVCKDYDPLRIIVEDNKNLKIKNGKRI